MLRMLKHSLCGQLVLTCVVNFSKTLGVNERIKLCMWQLLLLEWQHD